MYQRNLLGLIMFRYRLFMSITPIKSYIKKYILYILYYITNNIVQQNMIDELFVLIIHKEIRIRTVLP